MKKRQKMEFSDLRYLLFTGIFLSGIGVPWPLGCRYTYKTPIFLAQTDLTQWEYISPIS